VRKSIDELGGQTGSFKMTRAIEQEPKAKIVTEETADA